MSDLGAAWVAVTGTVVGAGVSGWFASRQAKAQERLVKAQLDFEREKLLEAERASRDAAEADARERAALAALGEAVQRIEDREAMATGGDYADVQRLAYQVNDRVLHEVAEHPAGILRVELLQRSGYLLRTPATRRTDDGHRTPLRQVSEPA